MYFLQTLKESLAQKIADLLSLDSQAVEIGPPGKGIDADFGVPCFWMAKALSRSPQEIAQDLTSRLQSPEIDRVEAINGYLNIWLKPSAVAQKIAEDFAHHPAYGNYEIGQGQTVISEFPSVNMAKPYSVGHLRPALQGWALYKLMSTMGYTVIRDNHLGDYGTPTGKWILGYKKHSSEERLNERGVYELADIYIRINQELKIEKEAGSTELADQVQEWLLRLEKGDQEACELSEKFNHLSLGHIHAVMDRMNIKTDEELGESFYIKDGQRQVDELLARGIAEQGEDGSVIVRLDSYGIDTPMLLRKSNGAALYATSDLATLKYRVERWHPKRVFHHVGSEQIFYFKQLFALADLLGYGDVEWVHIWHGMIDQIYDDGKREKMSSRKGVVLLEDLLDMAEEKARELVEDRSPENEENIKKVALGAIKFNDFSRDLHTGLLFDWNSIFTLKGKSGPYVQYAAVRISSILSKLDQVDAGAEEGEYDFVAERELLHYLAEYPLVLKEAAESYQAYKVADFLYELAQTWNRYYEKTSILKAEAAVRGKRIEVIRQLYWVFEHGLDILGIEVPSKM